MPVESTGDRAAFLDVDEFGIEITYTPEGGSPLTIAAIFDDEHQMATFGEIEAATTSPQIIVLTDDLPDDAGDGDGVTVNGVNYTARYPKPDGTGMTVIILECDD